MHETKLGQGLTRTTTCLQSGSENLANHTRLLPQCACRPAQEARPCSSCGAALTAHSVRVIQPVALALDLAGT